MQWEFKKENKPKETEKSQQCLEEWWVGGLVGWVGWGGGDTEREERAKEPEQKQQRELEAFLS